MQKEARSDDPQQQELRDAKKRWNQAAKEFVKRLIGFKQGLNGRGSSQYGLPPSKIQNSLPDAVPTFLNELTANYKQLADAALELIEQQAYYSEHRRQPQQNEPGKIASASITTRLSTQTGYLTVGQHTIPTLLAISFEEQARGLMYVKPPTPIMAFLYDRPTLNSFWMKDTPSELDIVFALNGKVVDIKRGEPYSTCLVGGSTPSDLVVELPYGTARELGIQLGTEINVVRDSSTLKTAFLHKYAHFIS